MFKNMKLNVKLISLFLLVGIIPLAISAIFNYTNSSSALSSKAFDQLKSLRDVKKQQIENYFGEIKNQVVTFSEDAMIIEAMMDFKHTFRSVGEELNLSDSEFSNYKRSVSNNYTGPFQSEFSNQSDESVSATSLVPKDESSIILQYQYIANNRNPLGSKNNMMQAEGETTYNRFHAKYHPIINSYLEKFGYYDIFLIDSDTGHVVYSVYKEIDYATSLRTGPHSGTNFASAFSAAASSGNKDFVKAVDFAPYVPSYNGAASFIASPIYDDNTLEGVLVFQMPIAKINAIMQE